MRGATQYDQDWIDGNVEAGVGGCGWKRPQPRPEGWTTHVVGGKTIITPTKPKKRPSLVSRVKARVMKAPPIELVPPPVVMPAPVQPIELKPRDPVDELLGIK